MLFIFVFFLFFVFCFLFFLFFVFCFLGSRNGRRLHVVAVEVALEVEVGERLIYTNGEENTERRIRLDVVLVLEVMGLDVVIHRLGNLRAAHEGARWATEEREEFLSDLSRALEDGRRTLNLNAILVELHAAAALAGILHLTVDTLLELLNLGKKS